MVLIRFLRYSTVPREVVREGILYFTTCDLFERNAITIFTKSGPISKSSCSKRIRILWSTKSNAF